MVETGGGGIHPSFGTYQNLVTKRKKKRSEKDGKDCKGTITSSTRGIKYVEKSGENRHEGWGGVEVKRFKNIVGGGVSRLKKLSIHIGTQKNIHPSSKEARGKGKEGVKRGWGNHNGPSGEKSQNRPTLKLVGCKEGERDRGVGFQFDQSLATDIRGRRVGL